MRNPLRTPVRRRATLLASGVAVVLAVGGGTTAAFAAGTTPSPAPTHSATCAPHLGAILRGGVPGTLKADLKTLRGEPKAQRAAERAAIRKKALSGAYGARAERLSRIVADAKADEATPRTPLPAAFRTDLKSLRATQPKSAERRSAAARIVAKALDGGYGSTLQQRAKAVQQRADQRCAAKSG